MRHLRTGAALLVFGGIILWLIGSLLRQVLGLLGLLDFQLVEYYLVNKILNLVWQLPLSVVLMWLLGWLMNKRCFRNFILKLFSKIPVLSTVISFFFDHNYIEKLSSGKMKVVGVPITENVRILGLHTNEFGPNGEESFVYGATTPAPFTGLTLWVIGKKNIINTKFTFLEWCKITASYGLNYSEKSDKDKKDKTNPAT